MTDQAISRAPARLVGLWQRNQDLLRNAGSLAATTGLTSVFGFVYWIIAARVLSQQAVGYGSAAISAMTLLGTIGMFGLGTVLIGELPKRDARGGLMSAAVLASGLGALLLGLLFPLGVIAFGAHFPEITGSPLRIAVFAAGVAVTGATLVFDEGTIGLMRGGLQLSRNLAMSGLKLLILPVVAAILHDAFGVGLMLAWVLGVVLSLTPVAIMIRRGGSRVLHRPDWGLLRSLGKVAMAHNWLNLAIATPPKLIPVLVTIVVSPEANAAFYVAWMIASFLFMVPGHLSTVLFAIASAAPEVISEKLRFVLRLSLLIGLPAMAVLALCAHLALGIFGHGYASLATVPLWLLILGYLPGLPKAQYIAVCRATNRVTRAAVVLTVFAVCEMIAVVLGGRAGGLNGLSLAMLGVTVAEGICTAPTVFRAASAHTKMRRAATAGFPVIPQDFGWTGPLPALSPQRQEPGLAALVALASTAVSEGHALDAATEVWRTGGFPAIGAAATGAAPGRHRRPVPATSMDLFGRQYYKNRQRAGLDALIALATPASAAESARPAPDRPGGDVTASPRR